MIKRDVLDFLVVAFGMATVTAAALSIAAPRIPQGFQSALIALLYMPSPLVAALVATRRDGAWNWLRRASSPGLGWGAIVRTATIASIAIVVWWFLVTAVADALGIPGAGQAVPAFGELRMPPGLLPAGLPPPKLPPPWLAMVIGPIAGLAAGFTLNGIVAFGEEAGWRGFLLPRTPAGAHPDLFVGVLWGLWHAPLILLGHNYGKAAGPWGVFGVAAMVAFCVAMSRLLRVATLRTGSVITAAVIHGSVNGTAPLLALLVTDGNPLIAVPVGALGALAALCASLAIGLPRPSTHGG